jgi:hypothetical protein
MKIFILPFFFLFSSLAIGQEIDNKYIRKGDLPEGVYMTLEDVLNRKPTSTEEVYFKTTEIYDSADLPEKAYFYVKHNNKKVKFPLAVSYKGELYFQTYQKYTNKKDRGFEPDAFSRFCKVSNYGRFVYFEESMKGKWSTAFRIAALGPAGYLINGKIRGIVLDQENKEFNLLRDCEDLNDFLDQHQILEIKCDGGKFTIGELRMTIDEINRPYR